MSYKSPLTYILPLLFIIHLFLNLKIETEQHFVLLAKSFVSGNLNFTLVPSNISDLAFFNGKYYWPLGPFPAILLIPFVLLPKTILQGFIAFPLSVLNFYLLYKIAKAQGLDHSKSLLLAAFFIFGSIYFPLATLSASWYFAQTVATSLLIFALYEFLTKRRYLLIGIFLACAIATRANLAFACLFFLYFIFKKPVYPANFFKFALPILSSLVLVGTYNFYRFQNPLESGYNLQLVPPETKIRRDLGLFSPNHIPTNLYYMILKGPGSVLNPAHELKPPYITFDSYGLSLFFLSPVLFLIFRANFKKELLRISALTSLIMLIPILSYYGIGQKQVGFRYALDFFPFIYLIMTDAVKKVGAKTLAILVFWGVFFAVYFTFLYLFGLEK